MDYDLPTPTTQVFEEAVVMALRYSTLLTRKPGQTPQPARLRELLAKLTTQFSRTEAERVALEDAGAYCITEDRLDRDIAHLRTAGSLEAVIKHYNGKHQQAGPNLSRVTQYLGTDYNFPLIKQIVTEGAIIDTPPEFHPTARVAPFRNLQKRLSPVYHKAVASMHDTNKVLLFRISDLTTQDRERIHMANEYHWRPEPGKVAGRPLLDCSNAPAGQIPLNSEYTRIQGIHRYQRVQLPTLQEVMQCWDTYRQTNQLQWNDMWMFKADITGCFNQLFWTTSTCLLMGFLLGANILMIMLTCGFGVAVTPMIWSVLGDALNRYVNARAPTHVFTYVDDFFGAGTHNDTTQSERIVHDAITGTLGPDGLSIKKNVHSQRAEILGILIDFTTGTMRPKDKGLEKLFYVLFSVDISQPLPLKYWQCLASLTNLYSHVIHGMRPHVSPILHMTHRAHENRPAKAPASTRFAIEIWRAVITVAILDPEAIAVPINSYLGHYGGQPPYITISDASPWRLCAAIYTPESPTIVAWCTVKLPYAKDVRAQWQGNREYLGHLLALILLTAHCRASPGPRHYQWINDNTGALMWAAQQKCSSLASQYACLAVTQLHLMGRLVMAPPEHRPGLDMGDIDTMSRILDHERPTDPNVLQRCPTLHAHTMYTLPHAELHTLLVLLDPSIGRDHNTDHHIAFVTVHKAVAALIDAIML